MPNTFAPNGFQQYTGTGSLPTFEQVVASISASNTTNIFFGDPVIQAAGTTGVGTGFITQGYGPVTLTVTGAGIAVSSTGVLTVTFTAATATSGNLPTSPNAWAPPIGSTLIIQGSGTTSGNLNGVYTITSSTTGTAVVANSGATISVSSTTSGTVTVIVPIAGVFAGCKYTSTSQKRTVFSNYWPGSDATGDVTAYITTDPNAQFIVQTANSNTSATNIGLASIGQNISFAYLDNGTTGTETNGNVNTGLSTMFADQYSLIANSSAGATTNAYLPFRIVSLANYTPGATSPLASINGNDQSTGAAGAYSRIVVGFNNSMPRGFAGI
jgi:hypothetical protein